MALNIEILFTFQLLFIFAKVACGEGSVCSCSTEGKHYLVACAGRNLKQLPEHIPFNTTHLWVTGSGFSIFCLDVALQALGYNWCTKWIHEIWWPL